MRNRRPHGLLSPQTRIGSKRSVRALPPCVCCSRDWYFLMRLQNLRTRSAMNSLCAHDSCELRTDNRVRERVHLSRNVGVPLHEDIEAEAVFTLETDLSRMGQSHRLTVPDYGFGSTTLDLRRPMRPGCTTIPCCAPRFVLTASPPLSHGLRSLIFFPSATRTHSDARLRTGLEQSPQS